MGPDVFLLRASLLDEEVSLLIIMEVVRQLRSVSDVAEKTIEFQTFQNAKVPVEVVAGHLTLDLKPERASALQQQLMPQMWEQARQGQEATILRPSSENIGLDSLSVTHPVDMTATPPKDSEPPPNRHRSRSNGSLEFSLSGLKFAEPFGIWSLLAMSGW